MLLPKALIQQPTQIDPKTNRHAVKYLDLALRGSGRLEVTVRQIRVLHRGLVSIAPGLACCVGLTARFMTSDAIGQALLAARKGITDFFVQALYLIWQSNSIAIEFKGRCGNDLLCARR